MSFSELVSGWDPVLGCSALLACVLVAAVVGWLFRLTERRLWGQSPRDPSLCTSQRGWELLLAEESMDKILSNLKLLHPDELREEILKAGLKCGPITSTTRCIFEKKLARTLLEQQGFDLETLTSNNGCAPDDHRQNAFSVQPTQFSEDRDFGYSVGLNPPIEETVSIRDSTAPGSSINDRLFMQTPSIDPPVFYAVCPVYEELQARNEKVHIYTDKKEALQMVKMMKGSRFKAFQSKDEAEKFARGICDYYPSPSKPSMSLSPVKLPSGLFRDGVSAADMENLNKEKANSFKSPRTQDLTAKLRKAVERGDIATFSDLIWSNPRYLIGSGDNPTVVQEGCRYNVLHVAAKENQAGISQLLLDTLENPDFMRLMYPDDDEIMLQKRIGYIVDLYLNTPDKMGFDTPLHFACKFGNADVANVLCSHPDIIKNPRNKYNQTPEEVICERSKHKSVEVKAKIREYLQGQFYVPLLRAEDNSSFPIIGVPWSPEQPDLLSQPRYYGSPKDPLLAVRAFAGPMSPSKAEGFRRTWKTPPRDRAGFFHNVRKTDPERGEERVGRELAHELDVPWVEYWEFLGCFANLSSQEGLWKLEEYLSKRETSERQPLDQHHEICNKYKTPSPTGKSKKFCNSVSVGAFLDDDEDMSLEEIKNRQNAALKNSLPLTSAETITVPECIMDTTPLQSSPRNDVTKHGYCSPLRNDHILSGFGQQGLEEKLLSPVSNLMAEFDKLSLSEHANMESPKKDGCIVTQKMSEMTVSSDYIDIEPKGSMARTECQGLSQVNQSLLEKPPLPGSPELLSSHSASQHGVMKTPTKNQIDKATFLLGNDPSKLDSDVLTAIENVEIDAQKYPRISNWITAVLSYSSTERQSWPSPAVLSGRNKSQVIGCSSPGAHGFSTPGRSSPIPGSPGRYMNTSDYSSPGRYSPAYASHIQLLRIRHFPDHSGL